MILNIIISILVGCFVLTLLAFFAEIVACHKEGKPIMPNFWIVPAIFAMAIYFCSHL